MNILKSKVKGLKGNIDGKHYISWTGFEFAMNELVRDYKRNKALFTEWE